MAVLNHVNKELTAKIVFYGPGLCGKTTNIKYIYEAMDEDRRGKILSLSTNSDRTLFFDFLPVDAGELSGFKVKLQLYTVPGQVFYENTRKRVLKGADGIVFVADSQEKMLDADKASLQQMLISLEENGTRREDIPIVMQYNKRDLPDICTVEELDAALNTGNYPFFEAIASEGIGVEDTLESVSKLVIKRAAEMLPPQNQEEERVMPDDDKSLEGPEFDSSTVMMDRKKLLAELGAIADGTKNPPDESGGQSSRDGNPAEDDPFSQSEEDASLLDSQENFEQLADEPIPGDGREPGSFELVPGMPVDLPVRIGGRPYRLKIILEEES
jgi:mutual gliding-motility protein MglA